MVVIVVVVVVVVVVSLMVGSVVGIGVRGWEVALVSRSEEVNSMSKDMSYVAALPRVITRLHGPMTLPLICESVLIR